MERAGETFGCRRGKARRANEGEELSQVEMLLLARLPNDGARRFGGEAQALDDEGRMAKQMRLADEMGQGLVRRQPLAIGELEGNAIQNGNRRRERLREQQCGGEGHWREHTVIKSGGTGISTPRAQLIVITLFWNMSFAGCIVPAPTREEFMDQKYIDLFDRYTHGQMKRREFLEKLTLLAGGTAAATALLPTLENNYVQAEMVAENDTAHLARDDYL